MLYNARAFLNIMYCKDNFIYTTNKIKNMNGDEDQLNKKFEDFAIAKKCPKCGKLSLIFDKEGKILKCTQCDFNQPLNQA